MVVSKFGISFSRGPLFSGDMLVSGYKIKKAKKPFLACCDYGWPAHFSDVLSLRTFQVQPVVGLAGGCLVKEESGGCRHGKGEGK